MGENGGGMIVCEGICRTRGVQGKCLWGKGHLSMGEGECRVKGAGGKGCSVGGTQRMDAQCGGSTDEGTCRVS